MSKLILFDFQCQGCNHAFEDLVKPSVKKLTCPKCAATAVRQIATPRIDRSAMALSPSAGPESIRHFERIHRERKAIEARTEANHGDYGKAAGSD